MKSVKKALLLFALLFLCCLGFVFVGCNDNGAAVKFFDLPSTVRVGRDDTSFSQYYTENPKIAISAAKNEYENYQVFFNADSDVQAFDVEIADLLDGKNSFSKNNISVYMEKCIEVTKPSSKTFSMPLGFYPDCLLPMDLAIKNNENKAGKNQNQGVWFCFYVPEDASAGVYTGTFVLKVNDISVNIPVSLTVWDFTVCNDVHLKTIFTTTQEWLIQGELDNTDAMYKRYINQLLDYRISTIDVPNCEDVNAYIETVKEYAVNPLFSAYQLPLVYRTINKADFPLKPDGTSYGIENSDIDYALLMFDEDVFETYIRALIENSSEGCNLFDKLVCYPGSLDECHATGVQETCKWFSMRMTDCLIVIADSYSEEELSDYGLTKSDIIGMDFCFTIPYFETNVGMRGFCPLLSQFKSQADREKYVYAEENVYEGYNGEAAGLACRFWYFCCDPREPYPTFHLDGNLIGGRLMMGVMSYAFGMDGILNWGMAVYESNLAYKTDYRMPRNAYETDIVGGSTSGDGFYVYPGAKYGVDYFLPSIRLMEMRDGLEDYEYFYMLENQYDFYCKEYGVIGFDLSAELDDMYNYLFTDVIYNTDFTRIFEVREQVAALLKQITNDAHVIVKLGDIDTLNQIANVEIFATEGSTLVYNGNSVQGESSGIGLKFVCKVPVMQKSNYFTATLTYGGQEIRLAKSLGGAIVSYKRFVADKSDYIITLGDGDYMPLTVNYDDAIEIVCEQNISDNAFYIPAFGLGIENLTGSYSLEDINKLCFDINNKTGRDISARVIFETRLTSGMLKDNIVASVIIKEGRSVIAINNVSGINLSSGLSSVTGVYIQFNDSDKGDIALDLNDIYFVLGE